MWLALKSARFQDSKQDAIYSTCNTCNVWRGVDFSVLANTYGGFRFVITPSHHASKDVPWENMNRTIRFYKATPKTNLRRQTELTELTDCRLNPMIFMSKIPLLVSLASNSKATKIKSLITSQCLPSRKPAKSKRGMENPACWEPPAAKLLALRQCLAPKHPKKTWSWNAWGNDQ